MPLIQVNGINIEYESHGDGEPLVLIAGLGYSRWMWHKMVPGLAQDFCVITFDNRGMGNSDKPEGPYTADLLAADTVELLNALHIEKTAVIGHSMGGFVAQAFALNYPERVNKLILSATNFGGPRHIPVTQEALAVLMDTSSDPLVRLKNGILISCAEGFGDRHPEIIDEWITFRANHPIDPVGYQAQMAIGLSLMAEDVAFEKKLPLLTMPVLLMSGDQDKVVPPGNAGLIKEMIPHAEIVILENAGHFFPFEVPETAVSAIKSFLKEG